MSTSTRTGGREATKGVIPGRIALSVGRPDLPEPEGFKWRSLTDLAQLESGHTPSRSKDHYWGGDVPWVGIRDATGNHGKVISDTADHVTQDGLDNSSARLLPAGTVCLSRTASVGYVIEMGRPMATSQDFVNWVCGPQLNNRYLRYVLMLEQDSVRRFAHGTTHQTMYYPEAKALNVLVPERQQQDAIAEVLGALDDKIAGNARATDVANALGKALFERDIDDQTVERVALGDLVARGVIALSDGYRTKRAEHASDGYRIVRAGDVADGRVDLAGPDFVSIKFGQQIGAKALHAGDVVLTTKGSVGRVAIVPSGVGRAVYSPQLCYFRVKNTAELDPGFLAGWFMSDDLQHQAETRMFKSDMAPYINLQDIRSMLVPYPAAGRRAVIGLRQAALQRHVNAMHDENRRLAAMRDELLPLMMSGKVRVRAAEHVVEGAV
jgi:type I restriction enzyme S subunit